MILLSLVVLSGVICSHTAEAALHWTRGSMKARSPARCLHGKGCKAGLGGAPVLLLSSQVLPVVSVAA